jgi:thiol-disulfide isomerase/thioredoxin
MASLYSFNIISKLLLIIGSITTSHLGIAFETKNISEKAPNSKSKIWVSFKLRKHETYSFQYTNNFFANRVLKFENNSDRDTVILKSIDSKTALSWSSGVYNGAKDGNWIIMQHVFLANPGDTIKLSYNSVPFLSTKDNAKRNIIADSVSSFYADEIYLPAGKKTITKDEQWLLFKNYLNKKYDQEIARINKLHSNNQIDSGSYKQFVISCKMHYYKKVFDWGLTKDGKYFTPAITVLTSNLAEIEQLINSHDVFLSQDLINVLDAYITALIVKKTGNIANDESMYNEANKANLGKYKASYLTVCVTKATNKTSAGFKSMLTDYRNSYNNTAYAAYTDSVLNDKSMIQNMPINNTLANLNGVKISVGDLIKKSKNRIIVIDFWASWCIPCRQQLPYMDSIKKVMKDYPVDFISINMDEKTENWKVASKAESKFLTRHNYYLLKDKKADFVNKLAITSIPRYLILKGSKIIVPDFYQPTDPSFVKDLTAIVKTQ